MGEASEEVHQPLEQAVTDDLVEFALRVLELEAEKRRELAESNTTVWMKRRHRDVALTCWSIASSIRARAGLGNRGARQ